MLINTEWQDKWLCLQCPLLSVGHSRTLTKEPRCLLPVRVGQASLLPLKTAENPGHCFKCINELTEMSEIFRLWSNEIRVLNQHTGSSSWGHSFWKLGVFAVRETVGETNKRQRLHAQEIVNQKWSFPSKSNCQVTAEQGQNGEEFPQPISTLPRQPKHPQIVKLVKAALDWQCPKMPRKNYALSSKASDFPNVSKAWASCKGFCWFRSTMPRNSRNLRINSQT